MWHPHPSPAKLVKFLSHRITHKLSLHVCLLCMCVCMYGYMYVRMCSSCEHPRFYLRQDTFRGTGPAFPAPPPLASESIHFVEENDGRRRGSGPLEERLHRALGLA